MLLYVVLILLAATALAQAECDRKGYWELFTAVDADKDRKMSIPECYAMFNVFDEERDRELTVEEIRDRAPGLAPGIAGHEQAVVDFIDQDGNGKLTLCDVINEITKIDTNRDGYKDEEEYESYINVYCSQLEG